MSRGLFGFVQCLAVTGLLLAPSILKAQSVCGVERWPVKIWADDDAATVPRDAIIEIVGLGFFDYHHGQRGMAPNAIEIHPVLRLRVIQSGRVAGHQRQ